MRKKLFTVLLALVASVGMSWATTNSITINESSYGSVVASSSSAAAGETITLTATPDEGYQLKSISGVYEAQATLSETLNATAATVNGNTFRAQATARNNYGWRVYNPGSANKLTISSKDGATLIEKIELTSTWGNMRRNNMLSVSAGTLSFDGSNPSTTVTINNINATSVTINGSGNSAGATWCISSAKIYYTGTIVNELEISDTENANVKTFTMVDSEVTISAEFEAAANPSGTCGDNLTWEFDPETGALTISGTGAMNNYSWDPNAAPWYAYKDAITSVSFPEGITTIGAYAFVNCDNAAFTTVTIPEGVTALGVNAFYNCDGIQEITIPSTVTTIEAGAIYDCKAVNSITSYIASPTNLHGYAIYGYKNTCTLYVPYNSIAAYQEADCWKYIPNIAAIPGTEPVSSDKEITPNVDPQHAGVYYSTFFDSSVKYALPAGVEAYVAEVSSNALNLTKIAGEGQTIPADNAVILKSSVANFTLAVSEAAAVTFTATNSLQGSDNGIAAPADCYVLSGEDGVVGFYRYTGADLNPHKAYVIYSGSQSIAPRRMPFVFNAEQTATGVESEEAEAGSRKVMENGRLVIIRNGVRYDAQGQVIE